MPHRTMTNPYFNSLLRTGLISELAVVDMLNNHCDSFFSLFIMHGTKSAHLPYSKATPYDIVVEIGNDVRTIEVKSANCGDRYPTFFAEIIQTTTVGYADILGLCPQLYRVRRHPHRKTLLVQWRHVRRCCKKHVHASYQSTLSTGRRSQVLERFGDSWIHRMR